MHPGGLVIATRPSPSFALLLLASAVLASPAFAQAPRPLTDADRQKIDSIVHAMTLEEKLEYIGGTGFAVRALPAQHLPAIEMSDGPYGTRSNAGFPSTTYAAGIGLAASWDPELAARVGGGIGRDARARGVNYMLGPGINIYRSPRNGRNFEYFGEDPFLTGKIAAGYINGMQQEGVSATVKHYLGNNSEYLRHDSDSVIEERPLREIYLPGFEAAVKEGHVGAVMDSYNLINGAHATQNGYFNIEVLRKEWKYPGVVMSDWDATYDAVGAANGGLDIEMPTGKFMNPKNLAPAIKAGTVTEATIDEKIRHLLTTDMQFGWLDRLQTEPMISYADTQNQAVALQSARESAVLLKNEGNLLPLDKAQVKTILVVGPDAWPGVPVGGGSAGVVPFHMVSPLEGMTDALGTSANVMYDRGVPTLSELARRTNYTTDDGKPGLKLEIFENSDLSGTPAQTGNSTHINANGVSWSSFGDDVEAIMALFQAGDKHLSRRYSGNYTAAAAGSYIVALEGGGEGTGNRVYLDGKLIIDDWDLVRAFQPQLSLELSAGSHKVVVEEKQNGPLGGHLRFAIIPANAVVNPRAVQLALKADVVLVEVGFDSNSESEGGDRTFALPYGQNQLIEAMTAANKRTIVTITSGGNVDSEAWINRVPALLETWYAGQEAGHALAEILFGEVNPSGHLPATFERRAEDNPTFNNYYPEPGTKQVRYKEGIFVGYRGYEHDHVKPLFPFGYGLSYTTFKFGKVAVTPAGAGKADYNVTFDVTNTGSRKGAEVAQVYISDDHAKVPRPGRELKGFERVELGPGETKSVSVHLDPRSFAYYDTAAKRWTIDPASFTVHVGDSVESTPEEATIEVSREAASGAF